MTGTELAERVNNAIETAHTWSVEEIVAQRQLIRDVMKETMVEDVHFGTIPGTDKPALLKPGAETLCVTFRFAPTYPGKDLTWHDNGHMTALITARLTHIHSGNVIAEGEGLCSTMEKKYAYRTAGKLCPVCGMVLRKSKQKDEWYCWVKKDGCGATFASTDPAVADQKVGRIANPDLADQYNTVLKMAAKRALIAATLNGTAASDIFTQDREDNESHGDDDFDHAEIVEPPPPGNEPPPPASAPPPASVPAPAEAPSFAPKEALDALCNEFGEGEVLDAINTLRAGSGLYALESLGQVVNVRPERIVALRKTLTEIFGQKNGGTGDRGNSPSADESTGVPESVASPQVSGSGGDSTSPPPADPDDPVASHNGESPVEALERAHAAAKARGIDRPCPVCGCECEPVTSTNRKAPTYRCTGDNCTGHRNKQTNKDEPWATWSTDPWKPGGLVETEIKKRAQQKLGVATSSEPAGSGYDDSSSEAVDVGGEMVSGSERRPSDEAVVPAGAQS